MSSVTFKSAMNMSFCYEHVTCGYDLVVMIVASQATCSGSNPGIRIFFKIKKRERLFYIISRNLENIGNVSSNLAIIPDGADL